MDSFDKMRELLNEQNHWPAEYTYKFIVPHEHVLTLIKEVGHSGEYSERPSKSGKYVSVTFKILMSHADKIIEVYKRAQKVPGILSL